MAWGFIMRFLRLEGAGFSQNRCFSTLVDAEMIVKPPVGNLTIANND